MNPRKLFLPIFTGSLVVINLLVLALFGDHVSSIARFISMSLFFLLFLRPKYYERSALIVFLAFVLNDFLLIYFEASFSQNLVLFIRLCAYLLIANMVRPYLKNIKIEKFQGIIFATVLILNVILLNLLDETIFAGKDAAIWEKVLLYGYGFSIILLVSIAYTFYNRYTDKSSVFFLIAVMGLVMSDFTYFIGFYLEFPVFYYLDRGFNVLGIGMLLHFLYLFKKKVELGFFQKTRKNL